MQNQTYLRGTTIQPLCCGVLKYSTRRFSRDLAEVQSNLTPTAPRQRSNLRSLKRAFYLLFDLLSGYLFTIIRTEDIPLDESGIVICEVIRYDFHGQVWIVGGSHHQICIYLLVFGCHRETLFFRQRPTNTSQGPRQIEPWIPQNWPSCKRRRPQTG